MVGCFNWYDKDSIGWLLRLVWCSMLSTSRSCPKLIPTCAFVPAAAHHSKQAPHLCFPQAFLDATSIELATSLLDALVGSLTSLAALLQTQQQQQQPLESRWRSHDPRQLLWTSTLPRALSEIKEGVCSSGTGLLCRGVLLSLLPVLDAGSVLGAAPVRWGLRSGGRVDREGILPIPFLWYVLEMFDTIITPVLNDL